MAEPANGVDVEMKEETAEQTSVHSIPSAIDQVAGAQDGQEGVQEGQAGGVQDVHATAPTLPSEQALTGMEGILNGQPAAAPTTQAVPPPVAQPPSASPLPATAAAAPAPSMTAMPASAPTPPPAPPTRPSSIPPSVSVPPEKPHPHGSPTRVYLNQTVTPYLLEGMKYLAANEPEKPLKWLSEFLAQRSAETEG